MFSKHSDSHPLVTLRMHCSTIFLYEFAKGEACTSSTTLSTNNDEGVPDLVCFLKESSTISAILINQEFRAHSAPLEKHINSPQLALLLKGTTLGSLLSIYDVFHACDEICVMKH